jgi:hypothetical protein
LFYNTRNSGNKQITLKVKFSMDDASKTQEISTLEPLNSERIRALWSQTYYCPAGLPISIITGKLAADRVIKEIGKG